MCLLGRAAGQDFVSLAGRFAQVPSAGAAQPRTGIPGKPAIPIPRSCGVTPLSPAVTCPAPQSLQKCLGGLSVTNSWEIPSWLYQRQVSAEQVTGVNS